MPGQTDPALAAPAPVEIVVPWTEADVRGFTDELVELSEAKRVDDFLKIAREAELPPTLIKQIERDCKYPVATKAGLKTAIARTAAKWLTKSGLSAKNKEEAALVFFTMTILLHGRRLKSQLLLLIAEDRAARVKLDEKPKPELVLDKEEFMKP